MEEKWCYSYNGENFTGECNTKEEAIEEAIREYGDDYQMLYIGEAVEQTIHISADRLIDELYENAREQYGDYAEGFLMHVKQEHKEMLECMVNSVIGTWMDFYKYKPASYSVNNIEMFKTDDKQLLKRFEIWSEGFHVMEGRSGAHFMGHAFGKGFRDACIRFMANDDKHKEHFNEENLTYWGCRLFDNEKDARVSFG